MSEQERFIKTAIQRSGIFKELTLESLANTGNNRVYRMEVPEGTFLVKHYFHHPDDPRDRFATERAFYSYLWETGIRRTPKPIHWLLEERLAIFEFIRGEKPRAATSAMVGEALDFFKELNANPTSGVSAVLPEASEACFSLREHLDRVGSRVARLGQIKPETEVDRMAVEFVTAKINPAWNTVENAVMRGTSRDESETRLPENERCISPSDFGFHNSIMAEDGSLRFFDFEYSGWDDPAKTICDFFCQPAVPVDLSLLGGFLAGFRQSFPHIDLGQRVQSLLPLYQIKWCCIILNEFLPVAAARRRFAHGPDDEARRKSEQLAKAGKLCSAIFQT